MGSRHVPARTVLFEREKNGVTYRVPALIYIPRWATMLAFAEERLSADDAHANLLVLRRGTFYRNYVEWEDMKALETALMPGHRSMNPCPIYDDFTGQLFLFFIAVLGRTTESYQIVTGRNLARLCYVTSLDQGRSWSNITDLTLEVIGKSVKEWATFALGPGHGIQLKSGRLLIPAYTYHIECRNCFGILCRTTPKAFAFRSDDHGRSWKLGELIPNLQTLECQMVSVDEEDGNNIVYCNARSSLGFRVQAVSSDEGVEFQQGQLVEKLAETSGGCHGSVIGFPAPLSLHSRNYAHNFTQASSTKCQALENQKPCKKHYHVQQHKKSTGNVLLSSSDNSVCDMTHQMRFQNVIGTSNCKSWSLCCSKTPIYTYYKAVEHFQNPTWVLYSHPTSSHSRVNLGVYLSPYPRDSDSWVGPWVIYEGPSAYSDLTYLELSSGEFGQMDSPPTTVFACLYENGLKSPYEQISFSIFTLLHRMTSLCGLYLASAFCFWKSSLPRRIH
uniref:exo-alpha-sialidase n=1 Tax=Leptobrachium leishanense TaxID=445787 RepID=A0A8C5MQ01_9ANUR